MLKQKRQELHTSERTIVPRTVIFVNTVLEYVCLVKTVVVKKLSAMFRALPRLFLFVGSQTLYWALYWSLSQFRKFTILSNNKSTIIIIIIPFLIIIIIPFMQVVQVDDDNNDDDDDDALID